MHGFPVYAILSAGKVFQGFIWLRIVFPAKDRLNGLRHHRPVFVEILFQFFLILKQIVSVI